jgi:hypothetical protein
VEPGWLRRRGWVLPASSPPLSLVSQGIWDNLWRWYGLADKLCFRPHSAASTELSTMEIYLAFGSEGWGVQDHGVAVSGRGGRVMSEREHRIELAAQALL